MQKAIRFYQSTIGKKIIVAITGLMLALFLVGHMAGNLKTLAGFDSSGIHKLDHYADFLRVFGSDVFGYGGFLWIARIGLLVALIIHVTTIIQLQIRNNQARPTDYLAKHNKSSTVAALTMRLGGSIILIFVVFHLLHLTFGVIAPHQFQSGQVYANVYLAFSKPIFVFIYAISMVAIGMHLYHGLWSVCQTLGIDSPEKNSCLRLVARLAAVTIALGFIIVPLAIASGKLPQPTFKTVSQIEK